MPGGSSSLVATGNLGKTNHRHRQARRLAMEVCGRPPRRRSPLAGTPRSQSRASQSRRSSNWFRDRCTVLCCSAARSLEVHRPSRGHTLVHCSSAIARRHRLVLHRPCKPGPRRRQPDPRRPAPSLARGLPALKLLHSPPHTPGQEVTVPCQTQPRSYPTFFLNFVGIFRFL